MVLNPLKIQEKNSKNFFLGIYPGTKSPFLGPKNVSNIFWLYQVPSGKVPRRIMFPHVKSPPRRSRLITEKSLIYRSINH
jgi:hypothetical protein